MQQLGQQSQEDRSANSKVLGMQDRMLLYIRPRKIDAVGIEEVVEVVITAPQAEEDEMKEDNESLVDCRFLPTDMALRCYFQQYHNL
jgi:hypothetical protein